MTTTLETRPGATPAGSPDLRPLAGVRVIDLCVVWTGPFGTELLGDLGAEVIKLENIHRMQPYTRGNRRALTKEEVAGSGSWGEGYPGRDPGDRPYERDPSYVPLFRNKLSMTVDLRSERGRANFLKLVAVSDALFENNVPETLEKLGITYDVLREVNPRLIMLRCPAFGGSGVYKNYRGWGNQIEAMCGHSVLRGYPDLDPTHNTGVFACDYQTGAVGAFALMAALNYREETGKGQEIELAQVENSAFMFPQSTMDYLLNGRIQRTTGNREAGAAPSGVYPCRGEDRWIAIAVNDDREWAALAGVMRRPELAGDDRFATALARRTHLDELDALLSAWTANHDNRALALELQAAGVTAGPIQDARDLLECPQMRERGFFERVHHRFTGTYDWPGMPFRMSVSPLRIAKPPVGLGEDNEYVYKELLGLSDGEYDDLVMAGEIGTEFDPSIP
jgi:crotonobetainyl-CoA:carnitine CoA-transferase CaiB-like acyl-CoA transferase